ncbi:MAG: nuclear transport factor 2 family protein [Candidatus Hydrogenedentes bacterium]|nr:nuclear transport factor 2 family protein [Candidatus Hydrogenedentota bacterium]
MPEETLVQQLIELYREGAILNAFDRFFHKDVFMMQNGDIFAHSKAEGRAKLAAFFSSIRDLQVDIRAHRIVENASLLEVSYTFTDSHGKRVHFDGVHLHEWEGDQIIQEQFATGDFIGELFAEFDLE